MEAGKFDNRCTKTLRVTIRYSGVASVAVDDVIDVVIHVLR